VSRAARDRTGVRGEGTQLPVPSDARRLAARLAGEERQLVEQLAALEERVRRFADVERPAYESWRRLQFGPLLARLQELSDELRLRNLLAHRVSDLIERDGLDPREALHHVLHPGEIPARGGHDPDEVDARRRAKLERKRAQRKEARRAQRKSARDAEPQRASERASGASVDPARVVDLYRALARRIHPDSPSALRSIAPARLGALWADVQGAYESRSLERLLALAAWVETLGAAEADAGDSAAPGFAGHATRGDGALLSFSERYGRLRVLRRSCRALERDIERLQGDPAWEFVAARERPGGPRARRTREEIDAEIEHVRRALDDVEEFFAAIGSPRASRGRRRR